MAEKKRQTFANHARLDPLFHFFALPVFGLAMTAISSISSGARAGIRPPSL